MYLVVLTVVLMVSRISGVNAAHAGHTAQVMKLRSEDKSGYEKNIERYIHDMRSSLANAIRKNGPLRWGTGRTVRPTK